MIDLVSRPYIPSDFSACLAIFDSNVPIFFAPEERAEFCQFLESINTNDTRYLVLIHEGSVVACGGIVIETGGQKASLSWGMVDRAHHGQGLGTALTQARLALARANTNITEVMLATSQHTRRFYEGFGFTVSRVTPNGFGLALDRWDMTLRL